MGNKHIISAGGRSWGRSAVDYTGMIENKNYPSSVNSFQQHEINKLWDSGSRMAAVRKLQELLEPARGGKTLLGGS